MKIMLAPMEGVLDPLLRETLSGIGGFDQMVTEFIRVTHWRLPAHVIHKYSPELLSGGKTVFGTPVWLQFLGSDPDLMASNALHGVELGAVGIDLNFGCPAKTVNRHDGGSVLLKDPSRVFNVIAAVRKAVPEAIPVSGKVRLGYENKEKILEIARAVEDAGATHITIHGRTKVDGYNPPADWESIGKMRAVLKIPVYANGDIYSLEDLEQCRAITGCENFAIGRPALSQPDLARRMKNPLLLALTWDEVLRDIVTPYYFRVLRAHGSSMAWVRIKQWCRYMMKTYPEAKVFFDQIKAVPHQEQQVFVTKGQPEHLASSKQFIATQPATWSAAL